MSGHPENASAVIAHTLAEVKPLIKIHETPAGKNIFVREDHLRYESKGVDQGVIIPPHEIPPPGNITAPQKSLPQY